MKDRAITAAGAILALVLIFGLFFHKSQKGPPVSRPLSTESGRNGYAAIAEWFRDSGIAVASLQQRYTQLAETASPYTSTGNILITTLPYVLPTRPDERQALHAWIDKGNTLLVMAALDDAPKWANRRNGKSFLQQLSKVTGLEFARNSAKPNDSSGGADTGHTKADSKPASEQKQSGSQSPIDLIFKPVAPIPLFDGVDSLRAAVNDSGKPWHLQQPESADSSLALTLAVEASTGIGAMWERLEGQGQIIVAASGGLLTNHLVAGSDTGVFLSNLVHLNLGAAGTIIFDDMHQGLSSLFDPHAFFADPRLHASLWFLVIAWLVYIVGSGNRFDRPVSMEATPGHSEFVGAIGGFMARRLNRCEAGKLMLDEWLSELRDTGVVPPTSASPWPTLNATPMLDRDTSLALQHAREQLDNGQAVNLVRLHNLINQARKALG